MASCFRFDVYMLEFIQEFYAVLIGRVDHIFSIFHFFSQFQYLFHLQLQTRNKIQTLFNLRFMHDFIYLSIFFYVFFIAESVEREHTFIYTHTHTVHFSVGQVTNSLTLVSRAFYVSVAS